MTPAQIPPAQGPSSRTRTRSRRPKQLELIDGDLRLREFTPADITAYAQCRADPENVRWSGSSGAPPAQEAANLIEAAARQRADRTRDCLAVELDGQFAGRVSLRYADPGAARPAAELGFETHPSWRGRGVATRASAVLCDYGFDHRQVVVVRWHAFVGNWASRRVAWHLGFTFEGTQRRAVLDSGDYHDAWVGSLLPDEPMRPRTPWLDVPRLADAQVVLRPLLDSDTSRVVDGANDKTTRRWLPYLPSPYRAADARTFLESCREDAATGMALAWAMADPADDRLLGCVSLGLGRPEIGYWAHPDARGRGVTTRALRLALAHAFGPLGRHRMTLRAAAPNSASRRVAEKAGMRLVGIATEEEQLADGPCDVALYELLATEFRACPASG